MTVIPMTAQHIPALARLEAECFSEPWSAAALAEELDNPHAVFRVATDGETVLGYAGMHHLADEGFLANVAVFPAARRQGAAAALIGALVRYGQKERLFRLTLEVRASNLPARALYEKAGFTPDGVRPHFYRLPPEDAVIYSYYYESKGHNGNENTGH